LGEPIRPAPPRPKPAEHPQIQEARAKVNRCVDPVDRIKALIELAKVQIRLQKFSDAQKTLLEVPRGTANTVWPSILFALTQIELGDQHGGKETLLTVWGEIEDKTDSTWERLKNPNNTPNSSDVINLRNGVMAYCAAARRYAALGDVGEAKHHFEKAKNMDFFLTNLFGLLAERIDTESLLTFIDNSKFVSEEIQRVRPLVDFKNP
jgi:hypothetical protein